MDDRLMMLPAPERRMCGMTCLVQKNTPLTLTDWTRSHSCSVISCVGLLTSDSGIVDEHVDRAIAVGDAVDCRLDLRFARDVHVPVLRLAAVGLQLLHQHATGVIEHIEQRQRRACFGESPDAGTPDAHGGTRHDADLALHALCRARPLCHGCAPLDGESTSGDPIADTILRITGWSHMAWSP